MGACEVGSRDHLNMARMLNKMGDVRQGIFRAGGEGEHVSNHQREIGACSHARADTHTRRPLHTGQLVGMS